MDLKRRRKKKKRRHKKKHRVSGLIGNVKTVRRFNPFIAQALKVSGLKSTHTCLQTVYFLVVCQTNLFLILCVLTEILSDAKARTEKRHTDFKFRIFIVRFINDTVAVKGLTDRQRLESSGGSFGFQAERQFCPPQTVMIDS